jgi:tetratricopeptide (TPR) repeat protein
MRQMMIDGSTNGQGADPPGPHGVRTFEELSARLRSLRDWAGMPLREVHRRVKSLRQSRGVAEAPSSYNTVYRLFNAGKRSRVDVELLVDVARVLLNDVARATEWRQAHRAIVGRLREAGIVRVSNTLPDDLPEFTGRRADIKRLLEVIDANKHNRKAVVVSAIEGMPGVGKTTLAVHVSHLLLQQGRFAEKLLSVNLRGYDADRPPADPAAVLEAFLRELGVPGDQIHRLSMEKRRATYQQLLAGRRALILLDNAASIDQVRPLVPDVPTCLILITSRHTLVDLPNVEHLLLDVFAPAEALEFLRKAIGVDRFNADPQSAESITHAVGYLPLALGLTASRINAHHDWTLADHLERLNQRRRNLHLDDPLNASVGLSYEDISPEHRSLLRLLSIRPGGDIEPYAVAALINADLVVAKQRLDHLLAHHLIQQKTPGRYEIHDVIRAYAAARAYDEDPSTIRRPALTRLFDHYLYTALQAANLLYPYEQHRMPQLPRTAAITIDLSDEAAARSWLDAEHGNLLAIAAEQVDGEVPRHTVQLSAILFRYLSFRAHYTQAQALHQQAVAAARQHGDRAGEADALNNLGSVYRFIGPYEHALDCFRQALAIVDDINDRGRQALVLGNLGATYGQMGQYEQALQHLKAAAAILRGLGDIAGRTHALVNLGVTYGRMGQHEDAANYLRQGLNLAHDSDYPTGQAIALSNLGTVYERIGHYDQAADCHQQAIDLCRDLGDSNSQAQALTNLGTVYDLIGRHKQAIDHHHQALALFRGLGDTIGQAETLTNLGTTHERLGEHGKATDYHQQALALYRDLADPSGQIDALNGLGEAATASGDIISAIAFHAEALQLSVGINQSYEQARAHSGLAHAHQRLGELEQAREHWQQALNLYSELGVPEVEKVRANLNDLNNR